jgi:hypothetical protein
VAPRPRPRSAFVEVGLTLGGESSHLSPALGGGAVERQSFGDVAVAVGGGKEVAPFASLVALGEISFANSKYTGGADSLSAGASWSAGAADLLVVTGVRLHTTGPRLRFFGDLAPGFDVRWISASTSGVPGAAAGGGTGSQHFAGSGAGIALLADVGLDLRLRDFDFGGAVSVVGHDVSNVHTPGGLAPYSDDGAARLGLRLFVAYPF